jgi:histidinol-phosphate aminotransferase
MLNQSPFFIQESVYRRGRRPGKDIALPRPFITRIDAPVRRPKVGPAEKSGTLQLDRGGYNQPHNDLPGIIQLHFNENLFEAARAATGRFQAAELVEAYLANMHSYPTNGVQHLQETIASGLNVAPDKVVISPGSAALLRDLVFYLLKKNDLLLVPAPSWSFYDTLVDPVAARIDTFPLRSTGDAFVYDRNLIAAKIEESQPKVVLICSPNNPTGNVLPLDDFLWLAHEYPQVDFIFDEAYYGFHEAYAAEQERELLESTGRRNVFVVRTFSKFYGLANLRLGFLICSEADGRNLQKISPVFGLPSLGQSLAATRFTDDVYRMQMQQEYAEVNTYTYSALQQIPGFTPYRTLANFILVQHDDRWAALDETLLDYGYKIKRETINGARNYFRITYADMATMKNLVTAIRQLAGLETAA